MQKNWLKKAKRKLLFFQPWKDSGLKNQVITREMSIPVKLVTKLLDITVEDFIKCYFYNDLSKVIKSGIPSQEEVEEAWSFLKLEYCDSVGGAGYKVYASAFRCLIQLRSEKEELILLCELLRAVYYKPFALEVNEICGTDYEFNPENWENYLLEINKAEEHLRVLNLEITLKEVEFNIIEKDENLKQETEEDFYERIIDMSECFKIPGLTPKMSMFEYVTRTKRMEKIFEDLNQKQHASS